MMRKALIAALTVGLLVGLMGAPADARKKKGKKKPPLVSIEQNYWLRNTSDGCASDATTLMTSDGPDGSRCGGLAGGIPNEILIGLFGEPCEPSGLYGCGNRTYTAVEGLPFRLDATKEIRGMIAVGAWVAVGDVGSGVGQTTLVIQITGSRNGESVPIGETEIVYTVTPAQAVYENEFTVTPDPEMNLAEFTSLQLNLFNRGLSVAHNGYSLDDPASFLTIPQWTTQ